MHLKSIELSGFKSFAKKSALEFTSPIAGIVGPNGSGKSNAAEAFRFVLGEQSMKAMRGKRGPDLIWSGNERTPRANRARVALAFDNKKQLLDIDFDEVVVERIVHRDGANEYTINGSKVRLKDVATLLSGANIGASGHHIISQGEADRILGASGKERREMIEEALGLRAYQYKKADSEKKLEKTAENVKEAKSLRREIAPHLTFLERQMKKLERSRELKEQLKEAYSTYVAHEHAFLKTEAQRLTGARVEPQHMLQRIQEELRDAERPDARNERNDELTAVDERIRAIAQQRSELQHARGRIEGQIGLLEGRTETKTNTPLSISFKKIQEFLTSIRSALQGDAGDISTHEALVRRIDDFLTQCEGVPEVTDSSPELAVSLKKDLQETQEELSALESEEAALSVTRSNILATIAQQHDKERDAQKRLFELKDQKRDAERILEDIARDDKAIQHTREQLSIVEHKAQDIGAITQSVGVEDSLRTRDEQHNALRDIERLEARLEEAGSVDEDTVREYEETKKRDAFLEREVDDLEHSKKALLEVIANLDDELSSRFSEGLHKINSEFKKFFAMLFDGGDAQLKLVKKTRKNKEGIEEDDEEVKEGIEISVQLPRKKVAALDVLSGGERALTSIALIFAMSQVNPPPFIILDETDAALDEANSRKYADMVRALSEHSQLILITHNRQTMEAAGELYGVTMGSDGVSKLLSVKFDEAVSVAK